ncbi:hypothetical protein MLD38_007015 [Melastoma candidum]|uniref:Uncharacterized protein n=1 Tax=Melastoma candidum TaxID=119954 RepID=A0ACB9RRN0_9MYRT|nr:hypothetical protein MLD38_007015 [Melastoma candidum]
MEGVEGDGSTASPAPPPYTLPPSRILSEDILFCIDVDAESTVELKTTGADGRPLTRLDSIKQGVLLFAHSKLSISPDHRFAFSTLSKSASWLRKEFSSDLESVNAALRGLSVTTPSGQADLTLLFRMAAHEAKKSRAQNRIFRLVLVYCRSSTLPRHQWPVNQKLFTFDVIYLHDKPSPDNCPQEVYDVLVDAVEQVSEYEGYILESGQALSRVLFRLICMLLSHPQQRCSQDYLDIPKPLVRKTPSVDSVPADEAVPISSQ